MKNGNTRSWALVLILVFTLGMGWCGNAPVTTIATMSVCPGGKAILPVTVTGFTGISAISLRIEYNASVMTFDSLSRVNTAFSGIMWYDQPVSGNTHKILISWTNLTAQTLADDVPLFDLSFSYISGTTAISFNNTSNGGSECEYADLMGDPLIDDPTSTFYHNGQVIQSKTLNLRVFLEGYYDAATGSMNKAQDVIPYDLTQFDKWPLNHVDTISVFLISDLGPLWPPDPLPYEYKGYGKFINTDGAISLNDIPGSFSGSYYIIVKHRQSVETWSASPVSFAGNTINYDFTTAASKAFGNNQKALNGGSVYGLYSGDIPNAFVPQDGYVDAFDNNDIFNFDINSAFGYLPEDLTGFSPAGGTGPDGFVDIFDMAIVYNNMQNSVGMYTPPHPTKK